MVNVELRVGLSHDGELGELGRAWTLIEIGVWMLIESLVDMTFNFGLMFLK